MLRLLRAGCMHGLHRSSPSDRVREHPRPGHVPLQVACPRKLRNICGRTKYWSSTAKAEEVIWSRRSGARFEPVLRLIAARGGIRATAAPPRRHLMLPISGFRHYELYDHSTSTWRLTREQAARLIYAHGPCLIGLFVTSDYYSGWWSGSGCDDDDADPVLYRGFSKDPVQRRERQLVDPYAGNHAAVCYMYEFVGDELHLRLLDNQDSHGPRLWVEYEAIDRVATLSVDPVDPSNWAY
uniref:Uncharacterized protein n=1 Tax=Aegilops tauschii TaxID=37682 RepID=M8CE97_AEGTA